MKLNLSDIQKYKNIEFLARQLVEGFITGLHKSPYHGFSVEFAEHRLYNTGESTRHIDWKVFARTDKLFTKTYEEETNLRAQIVIDSSSSMYYPVENKGKLSFSILASAALAYLLQKQRDAVGLCTFSDQIELNTPIKSTSSHLHTLFLDLERLMDEESRNKRTSVGKVLHEIAEKNHRRSLIIIFSDMFEKKDEVNEILSALQHLKHNKHEVLIYHVTDKKTEYEFDFEDRPYEFIDIETGKKLRIQPYQVRENYTRYMEQFYYDLKVKCGQLKVDFIEADINRDFDSIFYSYLIKRSKMK